MPSGYTNKVNSGEMTSAKEFIAQCAREFGAYIMVRDEPLDAKVPDKFEPSKYHIEQIEKAKERLEKLKNMTLVDIQNEIDESYEREMKHNKEQLEKNKELYSRYQQMYEKVQTWEPPTPDHSNLKNFCLDQLTSSIKFDCNLDYYERLLLQPKKDAKEWLETMLDHEMYNIEYHEKSYKEVVSRVNERNKWIVDLRMSLDGLE